MNTGGPWFKRPPLLGANSGELVGQTVQLGEKQGSHLIGTPTGCNEGNEETARCRDIREMREDGRDGRENKRTNGQQLWNT